MRCPRCGADNADDALTCVECGADLIQSSLDDEVARLFDELPTVVAQRNEGASRRIDAAVPLVGDGEPEDDDPADTDAPEQPQPEENPTEENPNDFEHLSRQSRASADGLVPLDETVLRPMAGDVLPNPDLAPDGEHFIVRNTRDYDHDAQSTNLAAGSENFSTIREEHTTSPRDVRRDPYARESRGSNAPGEGNSRSKLRPLLALLLVVLVLGGGGAVLTYGMEMWGGKTVPNVVGEKQTDAEREITDKGLKVRMEAEPADDAIGKVLSQSPEGGVRIDEGSEVTIVVAANRTIPEVVGLSEEEARAKLQEAGAERIETEVVSSGEEEGSVIKVSPNEGEVFVSRGVVTLTVAGPYIVPDVIGKKESDAVDALKAEGLSADVSYVQSDKTPRTVVESSPEAGDTIEEGGTVSLKVASPYPSDPLHLAEYFKHSSQDVDTYLQNEGWAFDQGFIDKYGNALATYKSNNQGNFTFSSQPYVRYLSLPKDGSANVLSTGVPLAGVRLELPSWQVPADYERNSLDELIKDCGFKDVDDVCNDTNIKVPAGSKKSSAKFICASGRMDDLVWTALVIGSGNNRRAVVTCAKEGMYSSTDLATFGGSVCQFVAYQDAYLSSEYLPKEEKKDDKKTDSKKDDKKTDEKDDKDSKDTDDKESDND